MYPRGPMVEGFLNFWIIIFANLVLCGSDIVYNWHKSSEFGFFLSKIDQKFNKWPTIYISIPYIVFTRGGAKMIEKLVQVGLSPLAQPQLRGCTTMWLLYIFNGQVRVTKTLNVCVYWCSHFFFSLFTIKCYLCMKMAIFSSCNKEQ